MTDRNCTTQNPPKQVKRKKQKYTTESFISRATEKHGGHYKYNKVSCSKATDKVEIYCPNCDDYFTQLAYTHLEGRGCRSCAINKVAGLKQRNGADFIKMAIGVHEQKYDYRLVVYTKSRNKVKIICNQCKSTFLQTPNGHLLGQGCAECGGSKRLTTEQFIKKAEAVHGKGAYDYSGVNYKRSLSKIAIRCKVHGVFSIRPNCVLSGKGCPTCSRERTRQPRIIFSTFVRRSSLKHESRYTYEASSYHNVESMVLIHCADHGGFRQRAADHMAGHGCKRCTMGLNGFGRSNFVDMCDKNGNGKGILYVIKCYEGSEVFYKVGITSLSIQNRFSGSIPYKYNVVYEITENGGYIYDLENKIHALLKEHHYSPKIDFKGSVYECFTQITKPVEKLLKQLDSTE